MKKCRLCGKKGLFVGLTLDADGYCPQCSKFIKEREAREALERQRRAEAEAKTWAKVEAIPEYKIVLSDSSCKRQTGYEEPKFSNITPKGKYDDVVVFDTETTGLAPSRDRILEIAAIRYINGRPVERFHSFINPGIDIPAESIKLNGITPEIVAAAPAIGCILPAFDTFVGGSTLVAHNLNFDLRFIYYSGSQVLNTKRKYIDTLEQAQRLLKKPRDVDDHKLDTLCAFYRITIAKRHSALGDAFADGELFFRLVEEVQDS